MLATEPKDKHAFVVGASDNYVEGITALFNSMEYHGHTADVLLIPWNLPEEFINALDRYSFAVRLFPNEVEHQVLATAIERFRIAYEEGPKYESICLLDADMFLFENVNLFFEVAAKGFIVTGSNGMIINFNTGYQKQYNVDLGQAEWPYKKVHTTAPIFIGPEDLDWFDKLYNSRRIDSWDDFLYLNILGIQLQKHHKMLCLSPYTFTGIHHWQLKVETCVISKGPDLILAGTEEAVYMAHGKFWDENYCKDLLVVMDRYLARQDMGDRCHQRVRVAHKLLIDEFHKYLHWSPEPEPEPELEVISWFVKRGSSSSSASPSTSSDQPTGATVHNTQLD